MSSPPPPRVHDEPARERARRAAVLDLVRGPARALRARRPAVAERRKLRVGDVARERVERAPRAVAAVRLVAVRLEA